LIIAVSEETRESAWRRKIATPPASRAASAQSVRPARRRALAAAKTLKAAGIEVRLVECRDPHLVSAQIAWHASDVDRIVLAGGDGTLSNAAAGIIKAGCRSASCHSERRTI
jgi:NAD kinase